MNAPTALHLANDALNHLRYGHPFEATAEETKAAVDVLFSEQCPEVYEYAWK